MSRLSGAIAAARLGARQVGDAERGKKTGGQRFVRAGGNLVAAGGLWA